MRREEGDKQDMIIIDVGTSSSAWAMVPWFRFLSYLKITAAYITFVLRKECTKVVSGLHMTFICIQDSDHREEMYIWDYISIRICSIKCEHANKNLNVAPCGSEHGIVQVVCLYHFLFRKICE